MGLFSKNKKYSETSESKQSEEVMIKYVTRLEPLSFARLGENGVDVRADELINIFERFAIEGSVFAYEINPLIADYLLRTGQIKRQGYNRELDKYVAVSREKMQNFKLQSINIVEDFQKQYKCEFKCDKCGQTHYIDGSRFRVDITFSFPEGMTIDYYYKTIPFHPTEDAYSTPGPSEKVAVDKYKSFHRMNAYPGRLAFRTLKQGLLSAADTIYLESGVRECSIYVFGIPFTSFMKDFLPESVSDEASTVEFSKRMFELEQKAKEDNEEVRKIRSEINELEKKKHLYSIEQIEANEKNDIEKLAKVTYDSMFKTEQELSNKIKRLWSLLLRDYLTPNS